ncbi:HAMP domain-containing protein [Azospirillum lipoferum]|uniref:histidine kinase n=1 Tax=Azospirillum lipoferum TaxID=193 RepID=A0A5A9GVD5_AZOLI|nr:MULTISPECIES: stimulus-sensing domain-containing protein [Azospirillum]KAA0597675.1 HAMP domain-containing protein [Azospirillum lipoferum]MDW5534308.1 stimulus-sensing domain-containing protein [Azospirillum sp. NL1]
MASATGTRNNAVSTLGRGGKKRRVSPLTLRILAVNVLALALLMAGLLYLGRYQDRLIQAETEALATEARIFASALGEGAVNRILTAPSPTGDESGERFELAPELARPMIRRLAEATATRTRLYDIDAHMLSDSRVLVGSQGRIEIRELPTPPSGDPVSRAINDLYTRLIDVVPSREGLPAYREQPGQPNPDVERALGGETAATVWRVDGAGGDPELLLTVAVPVQRYREVLGAVLLTRGGGEIDRAIRSVRFDILRVFAVALLVTVGLSFYLAGTIARPIRRLAQAADRLRTSHGRHAGIPDLTHRGDEIGELSGVLREMTDALWTRMDAIERFAADVAHEIKNPLTSLRSAVETAGRVSDPRHRDRLMAIIADDVQRLDRLISDISNASRLDAELSRAEPEPVDIGLLLTMLAELRQTVAATMDERVAAGDGGGGGTGGDGGGPLPPRVVVEVPAGERLVVPGLEGRLTQVFQNLIDNALSFSPPGGTVRLTARRSGRSVRIVVSDQGPGIPDGKEEAIFDRFYTERPAGEKFGTHSGLGLSIVKQIVSAHNGSVFAQNRQVSDGNIEGADFVVTLPLL